MDTRSYWMKSVSIPPFPKLQGDIRADVAVVGAGITGVTAAVLLKRAGKRVVLLEARRVGEGETGHTTAHLTEMLDTDYRKLARDFGMDGAALAAQSSRAAIDLIAKLVLEKGIAGFRRVPGFKYTDDPAHLAALEEECALARELGLPASMTTDVPLPYAVKGAMRVENQAELHPMEYLHALVASVPGGGCHVYEHTHVVEIQDGHPCRVTTDQGVVTCDDVIVAANVPLNRVFLQTKIAHYRTYAIAARLVAPLAAGLYWDLRSVPLRAHRLGRRHAPHRRRRGPQDRHRARHRAALRRAGGVDPPALPGDQDRAPVVGADHRAHRRLAVHRQELDGRARLRGHRLQRQRHDLRHAGRDDARRRGAGPP
jgi:glycine/D-amino acid oxidase-like deaminating enzyme